MKKILFILFLSIPFSPISALASSIDSMQISLLTCSPGSEIYSLFGHTAIRYEDKSRGIDVVFNYGMFSFRTSNFIWRFVKGETDYQLGATEYRNFISEYEYDGREVSQQTLNLSQEEKEKLFFLLQDNYRPENRIYRYNFFFDNCATRPRDKIEDCINGKIEYKETSEKTQSFRDIIHEYTSNHPWERFGIDLCLGSKADKPISYRQKMFAPDYLHKSFAAAIIKSSKGEKKALVVATKELLPKQIEQADDKPSFFLTPLQVSLLLFVLVVGITIYDLKRRKSSTPLDFILFLSAGIAGCIISFLACFSEHPTVSPNYLLFVFHPFHLLCLPFILKTVKMKYKSWYHLLNLVVLTLFILLWAVIPQRFDLAVLPLALSLLVRSGSNSILAYKKHK